MGKWMNEGMNETQLHEPMSDWRQPDEEDEDEDESVHHSSVKEQEKKKRRKETMSDANTETKQQGWNSTEQSINQSVSY